MGLVLARSTHISSLFRLRPFIVGIASIASALALVVVTSFEPLSLVMLVLTVLGVALYAFSYTMAEKNKKQ